MRKKGIKINRNVQQSGNVFFIKGGIVCYCCGNKFVIGNVIRNVIENVTVNIEF